MDELESPLVVGEESEHIVKCFADPKARFRAWLVGDSLGVNIERLHVFSNSLRFLSSSLGEMAGVALHDAVEMSDYAHVSVPTPSTGKSLGDGFLKEVLGVNNGSV